jgi:hypothetical protein
MVNPPQTIVTKRGCWEWQGYLNSSGYGPHQKFYERYKGPVPEGYELDHRCRNIICVNPLHLRPVSSSFNKQLIARARRGQMRRKDLRVAAWFHDSMFPIGRR